MTEYSTGGAVEGPFRAEEAYPSFAVCQAGLEEHVDGWATVEEKDPDHKTMKRPNHGGLRRPFRQPGPLSRLRALTQKRARGMQA